MNTRPLKWIVAAALLLACFGCAQPKYVHAVFFTCKDGTPDTEIDALIADGNDLLGRIPTVRRVDTGRRDPEAAREVNVTDYHVGLVVYFDDREGQAVYQDHPKHLEYVARHKDHWSKVRVLDFIAE